MSRYNVSGRCYLALIVGRVHPTPSSSLVTSQTTPRPCPFPFQSVSKGSIRGCKRPSFGFQALPLSWDLWSTGLDLSPLPLHLLFFYEALLIQESIMYRWQKMAYSYTDCYIEDVSSSRAPRTLLRRSSVCTVRKLSRGGSSVKALLGERRTLERINGPGTS